MFILIYAHMCMFVYMYVRAWCVACSKPNVEKWCGCVSIYVCVHVHGCVYVHTRCVYGYTHIWIYLDTEIIQMHANLHLHTYIHKMGGRVQYQYGRRRRERGQGEEEERRKTRGYHNDRPSQLYASISQKTDMKNQSLLWKEPCNIRLFYSETAFCF